MPHETWKYGQKTMKNHMKSNSLPDRGSHLIQKLHRLPFFQTSFCKLVFTSLIQTLITLKRKIEKYFRKQHWICHEKKLSETLQMKNEKCKPLDKQMCKQAFYFFLSLVPNYSLYKNSNMARLLHWAIKIPTLVLVLILVLSHLLHIFHFSGKSCQSQRTMVGKTVIVTGANTGIGKTTAMDLARRGARVILACRSEARTLPAITEIKAKTKNEKVVFMKLDLASFASVREFSRKFLESEERLDVLINNAGLQMDEHNLNEDGIEMTMAVNHFGPFLLTNLLLERLKASGPGSRIVTVSSALYICANPHAFKDFDNLRVDGTQHDGTFAPGSIFESNPIVPQFVNDLFKDLFSSPKLVRYNNSKLANVLITKELARRLKDFGVTSYVLHPGVIKTEMGVDRKTGDSRGTFFYLLDYGLPDFLNPVMQLFKTLEEGAQTTICCAVGEEYANESGLFYSDCDPQETSGEANDGELANRFWTWSEGVVGLS